MQYYSSPRWTAEIADCSMPMTFDTYSNCAFGCMYCFAQFQRALGSCKEHYLNKDVKYVNIEKIKKMFTDPDKYAGQFATYIKQRRVMQWGGMSDQFDGYERKYGKTLELLRFFKEIDYPLCFSTKAAWFTEDERYMELIRGQKNWNFKFSIITLDEHDAHFKELCHNGSCCGLPPTWNYSKGQFCEALQIAKHAKDGLVRYSDIKKDIEELHQYEWNKAEGFNTCSCERRAKFEGMSMAGYMRWLWNNPQAGQNPYKMFEGIIIPVDKDEEGNLIYKYNGEK